MDSELEVLHLRVGSLDFLFVVLLTQASVPASTIVDNVLELIVHECLLCLLAWVEHLLVLHQ